MRPKGAYNLSKSLKLIRGLPKDAEKLGAPTATKGGTLQQYKHAGRLFVAVSRTVVETTVYEVVS